MSVNPEDTKWTAYVLDEMGLPGKAELDAELAASSEAQENVDSLRVTVEMIRDSLEEEPQFRLTESQLQSLLSDNESVPLEEEVEEVSTSPKVVNFRWIKRIAALFVLAAFIGFMIVPGMWDGDRDSSLAAVKVTPMQSVPDRASASEGAGATEDQIDFRNPEEGQAIQRVETLVNRGLAPAGSGHLPLAIPKESPFTLEWPAPPHRQEGALSTVFSRPFISALEQPLVDCLVRVGMQGYDALRQTVQSGQFPKADDVSVADLINSFSYNYAIPGEGQPLSVHIEATMCPWNARHRLVQVGLNGGSIPNASIRPLSVMLLVDGVEIRQSGFDRAVLLQAITSLRGRIGTEGIVMVIDGSRIDSPVLRVLATDRAAGVIDQLTSLPARSGIEIGVSNQWVLEKIVSELSQASRNEIVLVLGEHSDNRTSERVRLLALVNESVQDSANLSILQIGDRSGNSAGILLAAGNSDLFSQSIGSVAQANRFWDKLIDRANPTVARDVKMQLEFNSETVLAYRPLRQGVLSRERLSQTTPAMGGDIVSGQQVTTLFEVVPVDPSASAPSRDAPVLAAEIRERNRVRTQNMLTVKLNYRFVGDNQSVREDYPFVDRGASLSEASEDLKFSASVAAFGMVLSDAPFPGTISLYGILELAQQGLGEDPNGDRREFMELVKRTLKLILNRGSRVSG